MMKPSYETITADAFSSAPVAPTTDDRRQHGPEAPTLLDDTGIDPEVLANLALKLAYTVPKFTTDWAARKLCLPLQPVAELLEQLRADHLIEVLGHVSHFSYQFAITGRGRERAARLLEISGYVGPAPVSLEAYSTYLAQQFQQLPQPSPQDVAEALAPMVLPEDVLHLAGLAVMSRRSLFLHGAPGNGKTFLGSLLHNAVQGELWIPYCIGIDENIIRIFDPECHRQADGDETTDAGHHIDRRWVCIKRPFVVVGGELTIEALDLIYSPAHGYYEAPLHLKANGGTFLLDDFGCQRVGPQELINRWIHPLERGLDFLTLQTGQQLEVPFRQMLIVSTNLDPEQVMSPAFLRRMGYRVQMHDPSESQYAKIFQEYAALFDLDVPAGLIDGLLARYRAEGRAMHSCESRDLIGRARDICRYRNQPERLDAATLDLAWRGYFGTHAGD